MFVNVDLSGAMNNSTGIDNEIEQIWTTRLMGDVVRNLKLYTEYYEENWPKNRLVYQKQPVNVDIDPEHLDTLDKVVYDEFRSFQLKLSRKGPQDRGLNVTGYLLCDNKPVAIFRRRFKTLPASLKTQYGTLTFTDNLQGKPMTAEQEWFVTINPITYHALHYLSKLQIKEVEYDHSSYRYLLRKFYKRSFIAELSLTDQIQQRGADILRQIVTSYNHLNTEEKHEMALRTEQFINERLVKLANELETIDTYRKDVKQEKGITSLKDGSEALKRQYQYQNQIADVSANIMIEDYFINHIDNPANKYSIIPSDAGTHDPVAIQLINRYNQTILARNQLLKSATETSPQVVLLTKTADELHEAIKNALLSSKMALNVKLKGMQGENTKHRKDVENILNTELAFKDVGRIWTIKNKIYRTLLKKREENIIKLASTVDNGQLIDEPFCEKQIEPRLLMIYGLALLIGLTLPYAFLFIMRLLRYRIRNRQDVEELTKLPILAEVPLVDNKEKGLAGIVVKDNRNEPIDDVFRSLRTNIFFLLQGEQHTILFTSSLSGEGKSFVAANLAISYATLGKRVILCGLDIRKPALGKLFQMSDLSKGITNLLRMKTISQEKLKQEILPSGINNHLDLLLAGPIPPNPTELLANGNFKDVITMLKNSYDYVILDTAPVGLVTDTLQFSKYVDLSIYVCRAGYTPIMNFKLVNTLTEEKKLPNTSIVINGTDKHNKTKFSEFPL